MNVRALIDSNSSSRSPNRDDQPTYHRHNEPMVGRNQSSSENSDPKPDQEFSPYEMKKAGVTQRDEDIYQREQDQVDMDVEDKNEREIKPSTRSEKQLSPKAKDSSSLRKSKVQKKKKKDSSSLYDPNLTGRFTFKWTLSQKPMGSVLTNADISSMRSPEAKFEPDCPGKYVFSFTMKGHGTTYVDTITVHVGDIRDRPEMQNEMLSNGFKVWKDFSNRENPVS